MIQEKFHGAGEVSTAYLTSLTKNFPITAGASAAATAAIAAWGSLFTSRTPISLLWNYARLAGALGWLCIVIPADIGVFLPKLFLTTTKPLSDRVEINAKRLSKKTKRVTTR